MALLTADYELIKKAQDGDQTAFTEAIQKNKALVVSLVNKYVVRNNDKEDLISIGTIGLLKAIKQFDLSYDVKFSTYAVPLILGELRKYFRDDGPIKVSRQIKETYRRVVYAEEKLSSQYQRAVTLTDIQNEIHEPIEDIIMAIESHHSPTPLENDNDDLLGPIDTIGVEEKDDILCNIDLENAIKKLDKKEQLFIQLRFFDEMKQQDLAKRFFVSQVQISRLEKKILCKLKCFLDK